MYNNKQTLTIISLSLILGIYIYTDQFRIKETLQNFDSSGGTIGIMYDNMYTNLTSSNDPLNVLKESGAFSSNYFNSNLDSQIVRKDFEYFNNATSIYSGYKYS